MKISIFAGFCIMVAITTIHLSGAPVRADIEETSDNTTNYYKEFHPKGYYHYEVEPPKPTEEKEKPKVQQQEEKKEKAPEKKPRREPSLAEYSFEEIWDMHPDDFKELLDDFGKKAVRNPTEENVLEYFTLIDVVSRKSSAFASVAAYVAQKHPELSRNEFPSNAPGQTAVTLMKKKEIDSGMKRAMGEFALILFCRQGEEFCSKQEEVLSLYSSMTDGQVVIKSVDMDENRALASKFNVTFAPTIILIKKGSEDYFPVTTTLAAIPEIEYKTYQGMRLLSGEINADQYGLYNYQRGGLMDNEAPLLKNKRISEKLKLKSKQGATR